MVTEYNREKLREAADYLPRRLREAVEHLSPVLQSQTEEIRLRMGKGMTVLAAGREYPTGSAVTAEDLDLILERATQASTYAAMEQVSHGFVSLRGGHRLGLCGTGIMREGKVSNLRQFSSMALRVAHQVPGISLPFLGEIWKGNILYSTLILAPPGWGKTTLLREIVRRLSEGEGGRPLRVGLADERGELAAMCGGIPQMDVGRHTDVMDGCPKGEAVLMLLRGMSPQVLAMDEVTAPQDLAAMEVAAGCGVSLLATAHGGSLTDLIRRPLYRRLLDLRIFRCAITIAMEGDGRRYRVHTLEESSC